MIFYDTQIISFAYKNNSNYNVFGGCISSIVANEFLLVYKKGETSSANYYLPNMLNKHNKLGGKYGNVPLSFLTAKGLPFRKKNADRIVLDFGNEYGKYIEFGNYSMAEIINEKNKEVFYHSIDHLSKDKQKLLKEKFNFLINNNITCVSVNESAIEMAFELIFEFTKKHNLKNDIRNSINDLLILSTAIDKQVFLVSDDNELNKFACDMANGKVMVNGDFVGYDFRLPETVEKRKNRESKGYINRGWQFKFLNILR